MGARFVVAVARGRAPELRLAGLSVGALIFLVGIAVTIWVLHGSPLWLIVIAWMTAGFGMGTAFPVIPQSVMAGAAEGAEARELSPTLADGHASGSPSARGSPGAAIARTADAGLSLVTGLTIASRSPPQPGS